MNQHIQETRDIDRDRDARSFFSSARELSAGEIELVAGGKWDPCSFYRTTETKVDGDGDCAD
jgi:hypothetical protein